MKTIKYLLTLVLVCTFAVSCNQSKKQTEKTEATTEMASVTDKESKSDCVKACCNKDAAEKVDQCKEGCKKACCAKEQKKCSEDCTDENCEKCSALNSKECVKKCSEDCTEKDCEKCAAATEECKKTCAAKKA